MKNVVELIMMKSSLLSEMISEHSLKEKTKYYS